VLLSRAKSKRHASIAVLGSIKVTLPAFCERKTQMTKPQTKMEQADPLSRDALQAFDDLFGLHAGFRPVHAKGILLSGIFTPSAGVGALSKAPHVSKPSIRVAVRFSDFAGVPTVPDYDSEGASPRGIAIRFYLQDHVHTDIIGGWISYAHCRRVLAIPLRHPCQRP
jgi:hypothetical protein